MATFSATTYRVLAEKVLPQQADVTTVAELAAALRQSTHCPLSTDSVQFSTSVAIYLADAMGLCGFTPRQLPVDLGRTNR